MTEKNNLGGEDEKERKRKKEKDGWIRRDRLRDVISERKWKRKGGKYKRRKEATKIGKKFEGEIARIWSRGCEEKKLDKCTRNYFDDIQIPRIAI